jgi:hypothetical protein
MEMIIDDDQLKQAQEALKMLGIGAKDGIKLAPNKSTHELIEDLITKIVKARGTTMVLDDSQLLLNLRQLSKDYL